MSAGYTYPDIAERRARRFPEPIDSVLRTFFSFETLLVAYIFVGAYKSNPNFAWLFPVDATIVLFALSFAVGLTIIVREGIYRRGIQPICFYFLFCAWIMLSMFWTAGEEVQPIQYHLFRIIVLNGWIVIASFAIVAGSRERIRRFCIALMILAFAVAIDWVYLAGSFAHRGFLEDRGYANVARVVMHGLAVAFGFMMFARTMTVRWFALLALVLFYLYAILIIGSRLPLLTAFLQLFVMLLLSVVPQRDKLLIRLGALPALVVAVGVMLGLIAMMWLGVESWTLDRLTSLANMVSGTGTDGSADVRVHYLLAALRFWSSSFEAAIFGNGILSFPEMLRGAYQPGTNPHNLILEIATEYGLIGVVLFVFFIASAIAGSTIRLASNGPLPIIAVTLFIGAALNIPVSADIITIFEVIAFSALLLMPSLGHEAAEADTSATRGRWPPEATVAPASASIHDLPVRPHPSPRLSD